MSSIPLPDRADQPAAAGQRGGSWLALVVVLATLWAPSALAGAPAPAPTPTDEGQAQLGEPVTDAQARALFDEALAQFRAGRYDEAIIGFEAAYQRSKEPALLFDIGQAYRLKGECSNAAAAYRRYLQAAPAAENRSRVEARLRDLDAQCPPPAPVLMPPVAPPVLSLAVPPPPPPPLTALSAPSRSREDARPRWRRPTGYLLTGGALASAGLGTVFAVKAASAANRTTALFRDGGDWDEAARRNERDGHRAVWWAIGGFAGAAVMGAAAAVLLLAGGVEQRDGSSADAGASSGTWNVAISR